MILSPPAAGQVLVVIIDPARVGDPAPYLDAAEREKAGRFHFQKDARHWSACRSALRSVLGAVLGIGPEEVAFRLGEFGKPSLAPPRDGLHFNLSHCPDLALLALCGDGPVGIDLEAADRAPSLAGCEDGFCHPEEIAALPESPAARAAALLDLWTSKEALLKALGTGMSLAPQSLTVAGHAEHPRLGHFQVRRLSHPALDRHVARIAVPRTVAGLEFRLFG